MIHPHFPELGLPPGPERAKLCALRALRNCGEIRVTLGRIPDGFGQLQKAGLMSVRRVPFRVGVPDQADCRLTGPGVTAALTLLKGPQ
ncbi:MAG: hypothetical protein ACJ8DZ_13950 [Allosphingosinicella sp.]